MAIIGCILMLGSMILIALGGTEKPQGKTDTTYTIVSILLAVLVGVMTSLSTVNMNYIVNIVGFSPK